MEGYKISYSVLGEQGREYATISKEIAVYVEELMAVNKQLSDNNMLDTIRGNLSKLIAQLQESEVTMKTAGDRLVAITSKYQVSETKAKSIIEDTGVTKKDFYGSIESLNNTSGSSGAAVGGASLVGAVSPDSPAGVSQPLNSVDVSKGEGNSLGAVSTGLGASPDMVTRSGILGNYSASIISGAVAGVVGGIFAGGIAGAVLSKEKGKEENTNITVEVKTGSSRSESSPIKSPEEPVEIENGEEDSLV